MKYRAVFCDIDGTLLDSGGALRPATVRAVRAVHAGGTPFILVSARSPRGVFPIQARLGVEGPVVCFGGALILDELGGAVHSLGMDMRRALELKGRIGASWPDAIVTLYSGDDWFVDDADDPWVLFEAEITGAIPTETPAAALRDRAARVNKILCVGSHPDILDMERILVGENPELAISKSGPRYLEIADGEATKANAMRRLCRAMGVSVSEAVAFGDNYNDVDMLEAAGLGVAMGNAPDQVKARADMVTSANDQEGVFRALSTLEFASAGRGVGLERAAIRHG